MNTQYSNNMTARVNNSLTNASSYPYYAPSSNEYRYGLVTKIYLLLYYVIVAMKTGVYTAAHAFDITTSGLVLWPKHLYSGRSWRALG